MKKLLGKSNIEVSALGLGCWPIGGHWGTDKEPYGYGETDDKESIRAIHAAIDNGINFFDSSVVYGVGHSEKVMGQAFKGIRDKVVIATKFCNTIDEENKIVTGVDNSPKGIRSSLEGSLRRLGTDYLDVLIFHDHGYPAEKAEKQRSTLDELVKEGKIRGYGWSTDYVDKIMAFNKNDNNIVAEVEFNIFSGNTELLKYMEENKISAMARSPLAMGLLTGKYNKSSVITGRDIRIQDIEWMTYFKNGKASIDHLERLEAAKEILTSNGRSLVQGALAYLWGKSDMFIPIPGFKTVEQVVENANAMEFGALTKDQVMEVEKLVNFQKVFC